MSRRSKTDSGRFSPLGLALALMSILGSGTLGAATPIAPGVAPRIGATLSPSDQLILFNGTNLAGFYSWLLDSHYDDPRKVFTVTNGMIRISGDGLGYLATRTSFKNYRLIVEYRWGITNTHWGDRIGKARDSGLFLHATGPDGNSQDGHGAFKAAIECNLFQGATGDLLLIRGTDPAGRLIAPRVTTAIGPLRDPEGWVTWSPGGASQTLHRWGRVNWSRKSPEWKDLWNFRGQNDLEAPPGEWNRVECICDGDHLQIWLNGKLINEASKVWPSEGQILLQCEGSEIYFRRVELRPAADPPDVI